MVKTDQMVDFVIIVIHISRKFVHIVQVFTLDNPLWDQSSSKMKGWTKNNLLKSPSSLLISSEIAWINWLTAWKV